MCWPGSDTASVVAQHACLLSTQSRLPTNPTSRRLAKRSGERGGLAGVFIALVIALVIKPGLNFAIRWYGDLLAITFSAIVLLLVAYIDFRLTKRFRNLRDESLPFVHCQLRKMVYLLFMLSVATYLGTALYGGWGISNCFYFAFVGIGFFVYGLFSGEILSWIGILLIVIGIVTVAIELSYAGLNCLYLSILGIGIPVLALVLNKPILHNNTLRRIIFSALWLLLIIIPAMLGTSINK